MERARLANRPTMPVRGVPGAVLAAGVAATTLAAPLASRLSSWALWTAGVAAAAAAAVVVDGALRRQDRALALVDQRTAVLQESLDALEDAQGQLVRAERLAAVGQLAATVAHELRNPLGALQNALYLIRQRVDVAGDDKLARHLAIADREVTAATLIVGDLLEFARGRRPLKAPVELRALVDEALSVAPPPDGVTVERTGDPGLPLVAGDRDQLRQVLLNFLTNAYDAMAAGGGTLTVTERAVDGCVQVKVTDSGIGMDPAVVSRIYEPFYTTKVKGVGLGLAVAKRIVDEHGGTLAIESVAGIGTECAVTLPVTTVGDEAPRDPTREVPA